MTAFDAWAAEFGGVDRRLEPHELASLARAVRYDAMQAAMRVAAGSASVEEAVARIAGIAGGLPGVCGHAPVTIGAVSDGDTRGTAEGMVRQLEWVIERRVKPLVAGLGARADTPAEVALLHAAVATLAAFLLEDHGARAP